MRAAKEVGLQDVDWKEKTTQKGFKLREFPSKDLSIAKKLRESAGSTSQRGKSGVS